MCLMKFVKEITKTTQEYITAIEQKNPEASLEREKKTDMIEMDLACHLYRATKWIADKEGQRKIAKMKAIEKIIDDVFVKVDPLSAMDMIAEITKKEDN